MNAKKMFSEIFLLKELLSDNNQLNIYHVGDLWKATFNWFPTCSEEEINKTQQDLGKPLPEDYIAFLSHISNGALLFYDVKYGQWGFKIFGIEELYEKQQLWQENFPRTWQSKFLAFAELIGDPNVMLFDLDRPNRDGNSYAVMEGNAYDEVDEWPIASRSFHEWLDHLVTAQGARYWDWK
jgi:hypothetical protein